jgi:hypothetical protein
MLIEAAQGPTVQMPELTTGDEILEWFSLSWNEVIRRDHSFAQRHLHRPVTLKSSVSGCPAGTAGTVVNVRVKPLPTFVVETPGGHLLTVGITDLSFNPLQ